MQGEPNKAVEKNGAGGPRQTNPPLSLIVGQFRLLPFWILPLLLIEAINRLIVPIDPKIYPWLYLPLAFAGMYFGAVNKGTNAILARWDPGLVSPALLERGCGRLKWLWSKVPGESPSNFFSAFMIFVVIPLAFFDAAPTWTAEPQSPFFMVLSLLLFLFAGIPLLILLACSLAGLWPGRPSKE